MSLFLRWLEQAQRDLPLTKSPEDGLPDGIGGQLRLFSDLPESSTFLIVPACARLDMRCPFCHFAESKVTDSRNASDCNAIRRRRECLQCARRFTTFETIDLVLQVRKRDGTFEDFQQHKLLNGLLAACRHTKISHEQVKALAASVTADLIESQPREISTQELGETVMARLQQLDPVAWIRFACVYRRFKDIADIRAAVEAVQPKDEKAAAPLLHECLAQKAEYSL